MSCYRKNIKGAHELESDSSKGKGKSNKSNNNSKQAIVISFFQYHRKQSIKAGQRENFMELDGLFIHSLLLSCLDPTFASYLDCHEKLY